LGGRLPDGRQRHVSHRFVASDYNAGAGTPTRKDIGVRQPVAITTARVRFSF
jgi:hypothetical protein